MTERTLRTLLLVGSGTVGLAASMSLWWGPSVSLGVLAGGLWNLVNLWCLARTLRVWFASTPPRRRVVAWFVVKFPLLYLAAVGVLMIPGLSVVGFGVGFLVLLASVLVTTLVRLQRMTQSVPSHGG